MHMPYPILYSTTLKNICLSFSCPKIIALTYETDIGENQGTGQRCLETSYNSIQYNWCCKNKGTPHIPLCNHTNKIQPPGCPNEGCPIRLVKERRHQSDEKVNYRCSLLFR